MRERDTVRWIYNHTGKGSLFVVILTILNIWSAACVTGFALLSKTVIDYAQNGNREMFVKSCVFLGILIASQMASRLAASVIDAVARGKAEKKLKSFVFECVLRGEYSQVTRKHSGDIMTRLTGDVVTVADNAVSLIPTACAYVVRIIGGAGALLLLDKGFAVVFILCGVVVGIVAAFLRGPLKKLHKNVQEKDGEVRSYMQEMTENLFAVKIFGIYNTVMKKADELQQKLYRARVSKNLLSVGASLGFSVIFAMGFLFAVSYGANGILKGTLSFGTVAAIIQLVNQIQSPIAGITGVLPSFFAMTASAQRLEEISFARDDSGAKKEITNEEFESIECDGVTFGYGDDAVLNNLSFTVNKGEFVGIVGESGIGKTTVFKLITGLYSSDKGDIYIKTNTGRVKSRQAQGLFSVVPQGNMLFSGTVRENLTVLCPDATDEMIEKALKTACADFVYALDGGLDFKLGEFGSGISEGQAQRIAVARGILSGKKILLMDESTSALDSETEKALIDNLKNEQGLTVIFISHRENVVESCDKLIRIVKSV